MKKHLFLLPCILLIFSSFANAQDKVVKYCQVMVTPKNGFTIKRTAKISFGEVKSLFAFKDTTVLEKLRVINQFTTETDVMNYMTKLGWELVNIHSGYSYTTTEIFYFRKNFDNSEVIQ